MLTFAGEPLLFPDATVDAWLVRNQDLVDLGLLCDQQARYASGRHVARSRFEQNKGIGLPVLNWPAPPPWRLNTLYWPTGATRYARGLFLVDRATRDRIVSKTVQSGKNTKATLGIGDDLSGKQGTPLAIDMFCLSPRPVTCTNDDSDLWLLPLVDERYFWQFLDVGAISVTTSTSWATLFSTLATALGVTVTVASSAESAYLKPDPTEFTRPYDNAALLLDAAAASVGRRFVRQYDGSCVVQSKSKADTALTANLAKPYQQLAGGQFSALAADMPAKVAVTFRKIKQYLLRSDNQLYVKTTDAPSGTTTIAGKTLTIHCAAYADYNTSDALQNGSTLDQLAAQIATDFYGWNSKDYDYTFKQIMPWVPCGYDDYVLWTFGRSIACSPKVSCPEGGGAALVEEQTEYLAQTRVQTLPANFWAELNGCSDPDKEVVEPRLMAIADADIAAGGTGTATLYDSFSHSTGKQIQITNISSVLWKSGKRGWAEGIGDAVWLGGPQECPT